MIDISLVEFKETAERCVIPVTVPRNEADFLLAEHHSCRLDTICTRRNLYLTWRKSLNDAPHQRSGRLSVLLQRHDRTEQIGHGACIESTTLNTEEI